jgi:hypothetical protein
MKLFFSFIISLVLLTFGITSSSADTLESQREALKEIRATANDLCSDINSNVTVSELELSGSAKAKLEGLIGKVVDLGIEGAGKYKGGGYNGPLQEQLAKAIHDRDNCRKHIFDILQEKMIEKRSDGMRLNRAHFEIVDGIEGVVFGGLMLSVANPTSEDMSVYGADWIYPAKSIKSIGGTSLDKFDVTDIHAPMEFPTGTRVGVRAGQVAQLPVLAYGCSPRGKAAWQYLMTILTSPKTGEVGSCKMCLNVATVSQPEVKLCHEIYCARLTVVTKLPC